MISYCFIHLFLFRYLIILLCFTLPISSLCFDIKKFFKESFPSVFGSSEILIEESHLRNNMNTIFPRSPEMVENFLQFLRDQDVDSKEYVKMHSNSENNFYKLHEKTMKNFVVNYAKSVVSDIITEMKSESLKKKLEYFLSRNSKVYKHITLEMMFNEKKLLEYLKNSMMNYCTVNVWKEISPKSLYGTPKKCIVYETCNTTMSESLEKKALIGFDMQEYGIKDKLEFDEVDDMFFTLVEDAVNERNKESLIKFDGDCINNFIKRRTEMRNKYSVDLLSDKSALDATLCAILNEYKQTYYEFTVDSCKQHNFQKKVDLINITST